jgi:insulysin
MAVEIDVANIEPLTKTDMKDFFMYFISPASPHRAKLSVHLIAQKQAKKPTLGEKKTQISTTLTTIFKAEDISPKHDALKTRIDAISSNASIPAAITAHLKEDLQLNAVQVDKVADKATAALGLADAGLPGEVVLSNEKMTAMGVQGGHAREPALITDVHAWKAGSQTSTGVRPVRNLEVFMEGGAKR